MVSTTPSPCALPPSPYALPAPTSHPSYSSSQPDFTGLGAFVIPGNKGSYWATEGLAANAAKRSALVDFVTGGGVLVLADGGSTGSNQFAPILDLFLGKPSGCVVDPITLPFLAYRRYADGRLNDLPSPIKVSSVPCRGSC